MLRPRKPEPEPPIPLHVYQPATAMNRPAVWRNLTSEG